MQKHAKRSHSVFLLVSVSLIVFLIVALGREYVGNLQLRYEIRRQEKQLAELEERRLATLDLLDTLSSEYYLEREGRLKQGLARPGEELVVITDNEREEEEIVGGVILDNVSYPMRWFYYFFDREQFDALKTL